MVLHFADKACDERCHQCDIASDEDRVLISYEQRIEPHVGRRCEFPEAVATILGAIEQAQVPGIIPGRTDEVPEAWISP